MVSFYKFRLIIRDASVSSIMEKYGVRQLPLYIRRIILELKKRLYPRADKIICQSNDIYTDVISSLKLEDTSLLVTIPNPIDTSMSYREKMKTSFSDKDKLTFIAVARFMPVKGHERLIRIFSKVKRPFILKLTGDGPDLNSIKEMVKDYHLNDRIVFTGAVVPPYPEFIQSDVYVQASYVEGFPNALLEGMGIGLPAIAFDVPGGTKEIINPKNGILVEDNDEDAFVKAIETFHPGGYDKRWISNDVHERFGIHKILNQYRALILD